MDSLGAVYVLVGGRDERMLKQSIDCLRTYADIPITVYSDHDLPGWETVQVVQFDRIPYGEREEHRNSSLWRLAALRQSPFDMTVYLDNDVFPVSGDILEGFAIAKHFGLSLVENPRPFLKELEEGLDVSHYDRERLAAMPQRMMALNAGLMFYHRRSEGFLRAWEAEQGAHPSRGQMSLVRAIWATKTVPYALPAPWLVCREHCGMEDPIALHCGHENVMDWWRRDFQRKRSLFL